MISQIHKDELNKMTEKMTRHLFSICQPGNHIKKLDYIEIEKIMRDYLTQLALYIQDNLTDKNESN